MFVLTWAGFSTAAFACKCAEKPRSEAYDSAYSVFYGEATEADGGNATIKVSKSFKRSRAKRKMKIVADGDSCDFQFEEGKKYLVFAAKAKKKKTYSVHSCSGTTALEFTPLNPVVWTLADDMSYGLTKRERKSAQNTKNKLVDSANKSLRDAVRKCDKTIWKSKKNVKGHIEVRFDYTEKRKFTAEIIKYERSAGEDDEVKSCLTKRLTDVKFPKFSGGPISLFAYRLLDQIDPMMVRKKSNASVVAYKSDKYDADE